MVFCLGSQKLRKQVFFDRGRWQKVLRLFSERSERGEDGGGESLKEGGYKVLVEDII